MNQHPETQQDTAYVAALQERLRELYLSRTPLPVHGTKAMTIADFYRFYRHINAEGYGR